MGRIPTGFESIRGIHPEAEPGLGIVQFTLYLMDTELFTSPTMNLEVSLW